MPPGRSGPSFPAAKTSSERWSKAVATIRSGMAAVSTVRSSFATARRNCALAWLARRSRPAARNCRDRELSTRRSHLVATMRRGVTASSINRNGISRSSIRRSGSGENRPPARIARVT